MGFKINTAVTGFTIGLVNVTDGSDIVTGTPVIFYTLDGGTQAPISDTSPVHEGNGQWSFNLTAAEMNGIIVGLVITHESAITQHVTIRTVAKIVSDLKDFDPATDNVAVVSSLTGHTPQTGNSYSIVNDSVFGNSALNERLGNLSTGSGGISVTAESAVVTIGTPTLSFLETVEADGILHEVVADAGNINFYYQFDVGGTGVPQSVTWEGYVKSNGDSAIVSFWNWGSTQFEQVDTLTGSNSSTIVTETFKPTISHVGTGANLGKVRLQFSSTTATSIATDRILCTFTNVNDALGFLGGAVWFSTVDGESGATSGIGTISRPSSVIADARTIANNNKLRIIHCLPGSSFALGQSFDRFEFTGFGYTVDLDGRSVSGTLIDGARILGNDSGTNTLATLYANCIMTTNTLGLHKTKDCEYEVGTVLAEPGTYTWKRPVSAVPGGGAPYVDFQAAAEIKGLNVRGIFGGIEIRNYNAGGGTHTMTLGGTGQRIFAASCAGGTLEQRGSFKEIDNAGGAVTVVRDLVSQNTIDSLEDTNEIQTDWADSGRLDSILDSINPLDASGIRAALGLTSANMDSQFSASVTATGFSTFNSAVDSVIVGVISDNVITAASIAAEALNAKGDWNTVVPPSVSQFEARTLLSSVYATVAKQNAAQDNLDIITGVDGVTLATLQALYAPSKEGDSMVVGSMNPNVITATSIASGSLNGKGDWNIGKNGYSLSATGLDIIPSTAIGMIEIAKAVWDRTLAGNTHNLINSAGRKVREVIDSVVIHADNAQSSVGIEGNQVKLAISASPTSGAYDPAMVTIIAGTGIGQTRLVYQYDGPLRLASLDRDWKIQPDTTSVIAIKSHPGREHVNEGLARAGTTDTIQLNALASSIPGAYIGQLVSLRSGKGSDQTGTAIGYDEINKIVTIDRDWGEIPDGTTAYAMLPSSPVILTDTTTTKIIDGIIKGGDIDGFNLEEAIKLILAASVGVFAGANTQSVTIQAADGSKTRITATVDEFGNRSIVVLDVTG